MNHLPSQASTLTIAAAVFGAPILVAFLIGSLPVLIPVLLFRWFARMRKSVAVEVASPAMGAPVPLRSMTKPVAAEAAFPAHFQAA
ncbi:MAG: hypothetical protein Q8O52_18040 [Sulfuritalea sp.]|nr:hypothetical protein [Sulfuritalea sp.]